MDLKSDKQQNIQMELDFRSAPAGEACEAGREETESLLARHGFESPANQNRWVEEVCERDNLKQHWPTIRAQLLNGTYEPQPVRRMEIPKPDGGGTRKLGIPSVLDRFI